MQFTLDSTVNDLLKNPHAKAVLEKYAPGATTHPMIGMAKGMSLRKILSMPQAAQFGLTQEKVEAYLAEVNKLV
jgi:hypothetical protein